MAGNDVSAHDRGRYARARVRGKARVAKPSKLLGARYHSDADAIELKFSGGGSMSIPRAIVPGLDQASRSTVQRVVVSPAGDALSWPSLNVDVYVPGLLERAFGTNLCAVSAQRHSGRRRAKHNTAGTKPKAAHPGRPRKRSTS
jgi:hypothetical protein